MDDLISRQNALTEIRKDGKWLEEQGVTSMTTNERELRDTFILREMPSAHPELIKDTIQKFHDYQVEWLTSHCDLEFEPMLESWVVRFLHDTANCYMMEVEHDN